MVQLDDIETITDPTPTYYSSGPSLLKKFDVPLQHLDFEYVNACKDANELEKILQILKSGEEGYYPQLMERTEQRLTELKPNSKCIRKTVRVLNRNDINKEKYEEISDDLTKWLGDISKRNEELEAMRNKTKGDIPKVRQFKPVKTEQNEKACSKRIKSTDYSAWDKYDAETELLKMHLEDKKAKAEAEKLTNETNKKASVKFNPFLTTAEAVFEAQRENEKGNEYFKANEYENSLEHYNNSIKYHCTATTFKNRASTYMAMKEHEKAIADYKEALRNDGNDFEALLRTGQCYQQLKKYEEARVFIEKAIYVDPNNTDAQQLAEAIRKYLNNQEKNSSKVRMKVSNVTNEIGADIKKDTNKQIKKSILKKEEKVIVPIPGTSRMPGPYYKVVNSSDLPVKKTQSNTKVIDQSKQINSEAMQKHKQKKTVKICEVKELGTVKEQSKVSQKQHQSAATEIKINCNKSSAIQAMKRNIIHQEVNSSSEIQDLKAGGEPCTVNVTNEITPEQVSMPYSFIQAWLSARKEKNYMGFAKIIRSLDMNRITEVIGNKLDATMLSEILNCLYRHFTVAHEIETVYNVFVNLCEIDRFNIIIMFLSNEDKTLLQNLVNFLKQHGKGIADNILRQYNLY